MAIAVREITFGRGVYWLGDLERYVALQLGAEHGRQVARWMRTVVRPVGHRPRSGDYTFAELVSLFAIAELVSRGLRPAQIAAAKERLSVLTGVEQPLAHHGIATARGRIIAWLGDDEPVDLVADRPVPAAEAEPLLLSGVDFAAGATLADRPARTWAPMQHVLVNPAIQLGEPCIARTRIQTWVIQSRFEDGETAEELQADFSYLELAEVKAALVFEAWLARAVG